MGKNLQPWSLVCFWTSVGDHVVWARPMTGHPDHRDPIPESMPNGKMMLTKTLNLSMLHVIFLLKAEIDNNGAMIYRTHAMYQTL